MVTRRRLMQLLAASLPAAYLPRGWSLAQVGRPAQRAPRMIAPGPFQPTWESLKQYLAPDWFRDAKFGIWAHWTAQCVPEQGDWYARQMYIQGDARTTTSTSKTYGHPSKFGFMEIDNLWKAEQLGPGGADRSLQQGRREILRRAGESSRQLRHLRLDASRLELGPHRPEEGHRRHLGEAGARARAAIRRDQSLGARVALVPGGLRLRPRRRPLAGVRYDAFTLTKEDGKGKWWEGLDPQELYTGRNMVMPDGITTIKDANAWHDEHDRKWNEKPPPNNPEFVEHWFLRCQELLDKYQPDLLYFDNTELPLGQAGLDIAAHFYNSQHQAHGGKLEAVLTSKGLQPDHVGTMVLDIERGRADRILPHAVADRHLHRRLALPPIDRSSSTGTRRPTPGHPDAGRHRQQERQPAAEHPGARRRHDRRGRAQGPLKTWPRGCRSNGEAIYGTRPFTVFGEGPPDVKGSANFNENSSAALHGRRHPLHDQGRHALCLRAGVARRRQAHDQDAGARERALSDGRSEVSECSVAEPRRNGCVRAMPPASPSRCRTRPADVVATLRILPK